MVGYVALFMVVLPDTLADSVVSSSGGIHRPAAAASTWKRTRCGSPASPRTDIISAFGANVTADNVKTIFGYPRPQMMRNSYHSLNGLWEFQPMQWLAHLAGPGAAPPNCHGRGIVTVLAHRSAQN